MRGWVIPPPREPSKSANQLRQERRKKVESLIKMGYLRSERIKQALLKVPREELVPPPYRDYVYEEVPLPLPGERSPSPVRTATRSPTSRWAWLKEIGSWK
jgi:hypothetical protein